MTQEDFENMTDLQLIGIYEYNLELAQEENSYYWEEIKKRNLNVYN